MRAFLLPPQSDSGNNALRRLDIATRTVSLLAGSSASPGAAGSQDGVGTSARFRSPNCMTMDSAASFILIVSYDFALSS